jgi:Leucine-rich repeat (LRR) protein
MRGCKLKPENLALILNSELMKENLKEIDVFFNHLGPKDFEEIAKQKNLIKLSVRNCILSPGNLALILRGELMKENLNEIDVSNNRLELEDFKELAKLTKLVKLDSSQCGLKPGNLALILNSEDMKMKLVEIDVSNNRLGLEDFKELAKLKNLTKLDVSDSEVKQEYLDLIWYSGTLKTKLREIHVSENNFNSVSAQKAHANLKNLEKFMSPWY